MSKNKQLIVAAVAGVGITLLFFVFVLSPKLRQVSDTREEVVAAQAQTASLRAELARLQEVRRNAPKTTAKLATVSRFLPSTPDLPSFIRQIQKASTRAGVDLQSIAPSPPAAVDDSEGIETVSVTLTMKGAFPLIEDVLARVENLERVVEVKSLSLSPSPDVFTGEVVIQVSMQAVLYVVQPNARLRAPSAAAGAGS